MSNILINGLKSKTGGGKSILNNYLSLLTGSKPKDHYYILTPNKEDYKKYSSSFVTVINTNIFYNNIFFTPVVNAILIPIIIKRYRIDLLFNLGDIVIPTKTLQLFLFDWPYAAYPDSIVWKRMDLQSFLFRRIKLFYFKKYLHHASTIIAQTNTMKKKLEKLYELENVVVVPNAVSLENLINSERIDFNLPKDKLKLLYLTYYYPHKNLEIFLPLAKGIKKQALPYCLIITIDPAQHSNAKKFINTIKTEKLDEVIINVGPVKMMNVPALYQQSDGLLMPTLLESFSGTYVEAMYHNKSVLTSEIDFATDVCGDAAFYFDPLNPQSILDTIDYAFSHNNIRQEKKENGKRRLNELLSWQHAFNKYQNLIKMELHN